MSGCEVLLLDADVYAAIRSSNKMQDKCFGAIGGWKAPIVLLPENIFDRFEEVMLEEWKFSPELVESLGLENGDQEIVVQAHVVSRGTVKNERWRPYLEALKQRQRRLDGPEFGVWVMGSFGRFSVL